LENREKLNKTPILAQHRPTALPAPIGNRQLAINNFLHLITPTNPTALENPFASRPFWPKSELAIRAGLFYVGSQEANRSQSFFLFTLKVINQS
jgi:hypothetical protein